MSNIITCSPLWGEGPGAVCLHYLYGDALAFSRPDMLFKRWPSVAAEKHHKAMLDVLNFPICKPGENNFKEVLKNREWPDLSAVMGEDVCFNSRSLRYFVEQKCPEVLRDPKWIQKLRNQHLFTKPQEFNNKLKNITVHMRRGDVAMVPLGDSRREKRVTSDESYLKPIQEAITEDCCIHILYLPPFALRDYKKYKDRDGSSPYHHSIPYSFGVEDEPELQRFVSRIKENTKVKQVKLYPGKRHFDGPLVFEWSFMVYADAFIGSYSAFSYVPAFLNPNEVYMPHNFLHPMPNSFKKYINNPAPIDK